MVERAPITSIARLLGLVDEMRVQNPKLQQTTGNNPLWFIRPYVKRLGRDGTLRSEKERIYLGVCSEMGKREAIAAKNKVMVTINREKYVVQAQLQFGDFLDHYEKTHVRPEHILASSTRDKYLSHLKNHIRPAFADLLMAEVPKHLDAFFEAKAKAGLSWNTRMDIRNILSGAFTQAIRWRFWSDRNPIDGVVVGRKRMVREKHNVTDGRIRELFAELPEDVRMLVLMGRSFTLSISEIFGLQEKHFDFKTEKILVRQRFYRGNLDVPKAVMRTRDIPTGILVETLRQRCTGDPEAFVFSVMTKYGYSRDDRDINHHFLRPAAKRLGIYFPAFGWHQFRRQAITALGELDPMQAQRLAGHAKPDMTALYTLDDAKRQDRIIRASQEQLMGVVPIRMGA
jgi:integrase